MYATGQHTVICTRETDLLVRTCPFDKEGSFIILEAEDDIPAGYRSRTYYLKEAMGVGTPVEVLSETTGPVVFYSRCQADNFISSLKT